MAKFAHKLKRGFPMSTSSLSQFRVRNQNHIVRMVGNICRDHNPVQVLEGISWPRNSIDSSVLKTMPVGEGPEEVELVYFYVGYEASEKDLIDEYQKLNLVPDPQAATADNKADPAFARTHPNGVAWLVDGKLCIMSFDCKGRVGIGHRRGGCCLGKQLFSGVSYK